MMATNAAVTRAIFEDLVRVMASLPHLVHELTKLTGWKLGGPFTRTKFTAAIAMISESVASALPTVDQ
jgi:hypothetical protein